MKRGPSSIVVAAVCAATATLILAAGLGVSYGLASSACWTRWRVTTYEFKTVLPAQCMVKHPAYGWVPEDKIRFAGQEG